MALRSSGPKIFKLIELGIPAEFVVGRCTHFRRPDHAYHAWVVLKRDEQSYVLEATAKSPKRMVLPLRKAKPYYCPEVSVDGDFKTYVHEGRIESLKLRLESEA